MTYVNKLIMKKKTHKITVSMPEDIFNWISERAEKEGRSLSGEILFIVRDWKTQNDSAAT